MPLPVDTVYADLVGRVLRDGQRVVTRGHACRRLTFEKLEFRSFPLVSVRRTAWKNALREWEFFMRGGSHLDDLHPAVRHWWEPFCTKTPKSLLYSYGVALRRLYAPDDSIVVKVPRRESSAPALPVPRSSSSPAPAVETPGPLTGQTFTANSGEKFTVLNAVGSRGRNRVYHVRFDQTGYETEYLSHVIRNGRVKDYYAPTLCGGFGYAGEPDAGHPLLRKARKLWHAMLSRCYVAGSVGYDCYGAKGVRVCDRWHCFATYLNDLSKLPGYEEWLRRPRDYHLDKDYYGASVYGPETCAFLPVSWNTTLAHSTGKFSVYRDGGLVREFLTVKDMNRFFGLGRGVFRGPEKLGYEVAYTPNTDSVVYRYRLVFDQIQYLLDGVRNHPDSRRNAISTWIPDHVGSGLMNPTNCHNTSTQVFVEDGDRLCLATYQRSCDMLLGVPHNWVQLWGFMLWLAARTDRKPGRLTWVGGDVHVYEQHLAMAEKIAAAPEPANPPPPLVYTPTSDEFRADDFTLAGPYLPVLPDEKVPMLV